MSLLFQTNIFQLFCNFCKKSPDKILFIIFCLENQASNRRWSITNICFNEHRLKYFLLKLPVQEEEEPVILTIDEVTVGIQDDLTLKAQYFDFVVSLIQKIVAISFIFVVNAYVIVKLGLSRFLFKAKVYIHQRLS